MVGPASGVSSELQQLKEEVNPLGVDSEGSTQQFDILFESFFEPDSENGYSESFFIYIKTPNFRSIAFPHLTLFNRWNLFNNIFSGGKYVQILHKFLWQRSHINHGL